MSTPPNVRLLILSHLTHAHYARLHSHPLSNPSRKTNFPHSDKPHTSDLPPTCRSSCLQHLIDLTRCPSSVASLCHELGMKPTPHDPSPFPPQLCYQLERSNPNPHCPLVNPITPSLCFSLSHSHTNPQVGLFPPSQSFIMQITISRSFSIDPAAH